MDYEDQLLQELLQSPGELYDIPEIKGQEDFKFDEYLKGGIDY